MFLNMIHCHLMPPHPATKEYTVFVVAAPETEIGFLKFVRLLISAGLKPGKLTSKSAMIFFMGFFM